MSDSTSTTAAHDTHTCQQKVPPSYAVQMQPAAPSGTLHTCCFTQLTKTNQLIHCLAPAETTPATLVTECLASSGMEKWDAAQHDSLRPAACVAAAALQVIRSCKHTDTHTGSEATGCPDMQTASSARAHKVVPTQTHPQAVLDLQARTHRTQRCQTHPTHNKGPCYVFLCTHQSK